MSEPLTPEQVRHLLSECVTVVKPGEVLVLRCPEGWTPDQAGQMQRHAARWLEANAPDVRVMVVPHLDMAVVQPRDTVTLHVAGSVTSERDLLGALQCGPDHAA